MNRNLLVWIFSHSVALSFVTSFDIAHWETYLVEQNELSAVLAV